MKVYKIVLIVLVIGIGSYFIGGKLNKVNYKSDDNTVITSSKSDKSELDKIMEEESFRAITLLRARKVANDNKKAIEVERNKQVMSAIESEYESIRAEEISLVGNKDVSLK